MSMSSSDHFEEIETLARLAKENASLADYEGAARFIDGIKEHLQAAEIALWREIKYKQEVDFARGKP